MSVQVVAIVVALIALVVAAVLLVVGVRAVRRRRWTALFPVLPALCLLGIVGALIPYVFGFALNGPQPFFNAPAPISASAQLYQFAGPMLDSSKDLFFSVQAQTGKILWQRAAPNWREEVADGGDTIYTERRGGLAIATQFSALESATGALRWQYTWQGRAAITPPRLAEGILYFVALAAGQSYQTGKSYLYLDALAASDGHRLYDVYLGESNNRDPQFAVVDGVAILQFEYRQLQGRRLSDGRQLWSADLDLDRFIATSDTVYLTSFTGDLIALDATSGAVRWRRHFESQVVSPTFFPDTEAGGTLYVVRAGEFTSNGLQGSGYPTVVYALDPATAAIRWTFSAMEKSPGAILLAGPDAVNVHTGAAFYALRARDGTLMWHRDMPNVGDHHWILSTFSHVDGAVLFVGAIEIVPEKTLSLFHLLHGQPYIFAVDQVHGSLYWGTAFGPVLTLTRAIPE